jgi:hypothetical protein
VSGYHRLKRAMWADPGGWRETVISRARELNDELLRIPVPSNGDQHAQHSATYWSVLGRVVDVYHAAGIEREEVRLEAEMRSRLTAEHIGETNELALPFLPQGVDSASAISIFNSLWESKRRTWFPSLPVLGYFTSDRASAAWDALHRAEEDILLISRTQYAGTEAIRMSGLLAQVPDSPSSPEVKLYKAFLDTFKPPKLSDEPPAALGQSARELLREILNFLNVRSERANGDLRSHRNALVVLTMTAVLAAVAVALVAAHNPSLVSLCTAATPASPSPAPSPSTLPSPSAAASTSRSAVAAVSCFVATPVPGPLDWSLVALFGALGGLLSAVFVLWNVSSYRNPYGIQLIQALSKLPFGAVAALIGVMVMQAGIFDVVKSQTGVRILGYAVIFGFAQQALTRQLDSRANSLLEGAHAKSTTSPSTVDSTGQT